jgi:hypothetical protein
MLIWRAMGHKEFFQRKTEVADPAIIAGGPAGGSV